MNEAKRSLVHIHQGHSRSLQLVMNEVPTNGGQEQTWCEMWRAARMQTLGLEHVLLMDQSIQAEAFMSANF